LKIENIETRSVDKSKNQFLLLHGNSKEILKTMPENLVHTVVTSPPYWQLRDYFADDQLGQESTPEEYVDNLVAICREVKRVLRQDGTFWLNIGDSYNNNSGHTRSKKEWQRKGRLNGSADKKAFKHSTIKTKDLIGMPWKVAFALQNDGWYLRCDIIWKKLNPMPDGAKDRPTRSHEYMFLLSKSPKYFYDYYAVLEETDSHPDKIQGFGANDQQGTYRMDQTRKFEHYGKRNKRSVWSTAVATSGKGHFATYPEKLIDPCVKASTSAKGCCADCSTPWFRNFEKEKVASDNGKGYTLELVDKGWEKGCKCETNEVNPCIVLDPFNGSGTTGKVALKYDHNYIGIDTNEEYLDVARYNINASSKNTENSDVYEPSNLENFLND